MQPYQHLLVATDFSAPALAGVRLAARLAPPLDARVTLAHVREAAPYPAGVTARALDSVARGRDRDPALELLALLDELRRAELADCRAELDVSSHRDVALGICELARSKRADVCVVGSHGRTGLAHLLLGSVAERVMRQADCDALVARPAPAPGDRRVIIATTDFSHGAESALERARLLARGLGVGLELLHVHDDGDEPRDSSGAVKGQLEQRLSQLRHAHFDSGEDVGSSVVVASDIAEAIARFAADYAAEMVVVGSHGRTGGPRLFTGSVAARAARLAPCPVLVVRPRRRALQGAG
jgi:nucleotide-binding universal stress UspA family protein